MYEPIAYFEHDADMGIVGRGKCIEEAFEHAAAAMFALMTSLDKVELRMRIAIEFEEADAELALVTWLNQLLGEARSRALIFGRFHLRRAGTSPKGSSSGASPKGTFPPSGSETSGARWSGTAEGEPWHAGLERGVEVKGATLTELSVAQRNGIWEARCVVDV